MKEVKKGIVFSNDIERILKGINSYEFNYEVNIKKEFLKGLREYFKKDVSRIFDYVTIISEEEMMMVNNLIGGDLPHCYTR